MGPFSWLKRQEEEVRDNASGSGSGSVDAWVRGVHVKTEPECIKEAKEVEGKQVLRLEVETDLVREVSPKPSASDPFLPIPAPLVDTSPYPSSSPSPSPSSPSPSPPRASRQLKSLSHYLSEYADQSDGWEPSGLSGIDFGFDPDSGSGLDSVLDLSTCLREEG